MDEVEVRMQAARMAQESFTSAPDLVLAKKIADFVLTGKVPDTNSTTS